MQAELLLLPIVLPVVFWAGYHYHKDRHLPEPPDNLLLCFLLGMLAATVDPLITPITMRCQNLINPE